MTRICDALGHELTGADPAAAALFDSALAELQCYRGDPLGALDAALARQPGFAMAHAMKAWILLLGTEPALAAPAAEAAAAALRHAATDRERGHAVALSHLAAGRWREAGAALSALSAAYPRDGLALLAGHQIDYFTGDARTLRDRIARALPSWHEAMPGFHAMLAMHAFGLEETGDYTAAEAAGRRAVALEPRDGWAQHAVAHVFEMQDRLAEGIAWMRGSDAWAGDSFLQGHNWWHLALYHHELGDQDAALGLYDAHVYPDRSRLALRMIDASALLWRLWLAGAAVGGRWQALAEDWAAAGGAGIHAFNDVHAVMAFVGAGQAERAAGVLEAQRRAMAGTGDNARMTAEVGHPLARALIAFGAGDWAGAAALLERVQPVAQRFGGSHAQRDVIALTLIEATIRAGDSARARALTAGRRLRRPASVLAGALQARAAAMAG